MSLPSQPAIDAIASLAEVLDEVVTHTTPVLRHFLAVLGIDTSELDFRALLKEVERLNIPVIDTRTCIALRRMLNSSFHQNAQSKEVVMATLRGFVDFLVSIQRFGTTF
ncbi:uncharacterized protein AMSG_05083 [Thecamonas trahens ATCC 50062]|uniref:Uncharacterized protein n=1 Tax=Thecamonas trahens ATCC 50062 TaxID=461836 RepID=A0A0L0DCS8_THETB|nr:hypothetical protein AMSG_05083 [Thecamonas trahens ATCC 50062]KNC49113.1 hypothetical protein AMSG_05083 [Thecamonas trahens ATCC 50062]|eukprot:XP_013758141.1 hypothetical protein AMSG_05083 [Thecamonas trahens ATCC 50062]